jgi:DNA-binding cell septation regulator SpoVG
MTDGTFKDVAHPITMEFRAQLEEKIFSCYKKELAKMKESLVSDLLK